MPNFHSCINSIPMSLFETRHRRPFSICAFQHCHPACPGRGALFAPRMLHRGRRDRSSGVLCRYAMEGPRQPINRYITRSADLRPLSISSPPFHLFTFLILPIHFSSCGNSFFHLTLHFPSRYLYIVSDVHSQNANLAFSAPNQGDSCPLNCAIFSLSLTTNSKIAISKPKSSAKIAPPFIKFKKNASNTSPTKSASRPSPSFSATSKAACTCSITTKNSF